MGKVYRALDTRLHRTVAIKFSKLPFTEAFRREARTAASLNHPNVVQIYELGSANEDEFIVMEFVPGRSLAELMREKRLSLKEALDCSQQIVSALAAAHAGGIIHGDIKPGNIIVNDQAGSRQDSRLRARNAGASAFAGRPYALCPGKRDLFRAGHSILYVS